MFTYHYWFDCCLIACRGGVVRGVPPTRSPLPTPRVMPAKTKIMSILDRARAAMEETYG